jgi:crotonobetainyl-CoA:carnitine CoA-transferase CaiB-like acyl-CoA transferase
MNELPLEGIRVVALEQAVAAPFCSRHLADLGADVVKVERPECGDFSRAYDESLNGFSAYFAWLNRGKRSLVLDLKQDSGRGTLRRLVARADVFLHNLLPGAVERMGLGFETVHEQFPRLIWCGISGYGPDGPYRDKRAYDLLVQGESGVIELTGSATEPAKLGIAVADIGAGMYAYSSILAALIARGRTGKGTRIDISMLECLAEWLTQPLYVFRGTGKVLPRAGVRHATVVPYGLYPCSYGAVNFGIQNDREFARLCAEVLEMPELAADERFATNVARVKNRVELELRIEAWMGRRTQAEVLAALDRAGIANGAVNDIAGLSRHPQLVARGRWMEVDSPVGPIPALLPPHNLQGAGPRAGRVPALGEHTEEILKELEGEHG